MPWHVTDGDAGSTIAISSCGSVPAASDAGYSEWLEGKKERAKLRQQRVDTSRIILDVANVLGEWTKAQHVATATQRWEPSLHYGLKRIESRWEALASVVQYYAHRGKFVVGVMSPELSRDLPQTLSASFGDVVPSVSDDQTVIQLAREDHCPFLSNDNYHDWATKSRSISNFLQAAGCRLHVKYSFSRGGRFVPTVDIDSLAEEGDDEDWRELDRPTVEGGRYDIGKGSGDASRHQASWTTNSGRDEKDVGEGSAFSDSRGDRNAWEEQGGWLAHTGSPYEKGSGGGSAAVWASRDGGDAWGYHSDWQSQDDWSKRAAWRGRDNKKSQECRHTLGPQCVSFHVPNLGWGVFEDHVAELREQLREGGLVVRSCQRGQRLVQSLEDIPEEQEAEWKPEVDEVAPLYLRVVEVEGPARQIQALRCKKWLIKISQPEGDPLVLKFLPPKSKPTVGGGGRRVAAPRTSASRMSAPAAASATAAPSRVPSASDNASSAPASSPPSTMSAASLLSVPLASSSVSAPPTLSFASQPSAPASSSVSAALSGRGAASLPPSQASRVASSAMSPVPGTVRPLAFPCRGRLPASQGGYSRCRSTSSTSESVPRSRSASESLSRPPTLSVSAE